MKIITVLGDSLSLARSEYGIYYKNIYPYLLNERMGCDFLVLNKSKRSNTLVKQSGAQFIYDDVLTTNSNYFIIQLGIVDCSPRVVSMLEKKIIRNFLPGSLRKLYLDFKSKHRRFFTKYFPKTYFTIDIFEKKYRYLLETICSQPQVKRVIIINIADTNPTNKYRSFGFEKNILKYNEIIFNLTKKFDSKIGFVDLHSLTKENPDLLLDDGIHVTRKAQIIITTHIEKLLLH
jgi:lysophospholipase L1-like esterase